MQIMLLFKKTTQRITVASETKDALKNFVAQLNAKKPKNVKISSIEEDSDRWACSIHCMDAVALYNKELLPLLYSSNEPDLFEVVVEFEDESKAAKFYPVEILLSFSLTSGYTFGDRAEVELIQKLYKYFSHHSKNMETAIAYYIVSGGAVTMAIPCTEPEEASRIVRNKLKASGVTTLKISVAARQRV